MGLSFGGTDSQSNATSSQNQSNVYGGDQQTLQTMLGQLFQAIVPSMTSGSLTPATAATTTANADQINKNFANEGNTLQTQLAARGLSGSGLSGESTLQTELARQGAQAGNLEAGSQSQLAQNNTDLLAALQYAFNPTGSTATGTGTNTGSTSGWGASIGGAGGITPSGALFGAIGA